MNVTGAVTTLTIALAAIGCASVDNVVYTPVNESPRVLRTRIEESVDVFVGRPPTRPHVDVGIFEVYQGTTDSGSGHSTEEMLQTIRLHGALRGCDAIQILSVEVEGRYQNRVLRGVCETYTDERSARDATALRPHAPLPGEGQYCGDYTLSTRNPPETAQCFAPLVCESHVCTHPYK